MPPEAAPASASHEVLVPHLHPRLEDPETHALLHQPEILRELLRTEGLPLLSHPVNGKVLRMYLMSHEDFVQRFEPYRRSRFFATHGTGGRESHLPIDDALNDFPRIFDATTQCRGGGAGADDGWKDITDSLITASLSKAEGWLRSGPLVNQLGFFLTQASLEDPRGERVIFRATLVLESLVDEATVRENLRRRMPQPERLSAGVTPTAAGVLRFEELRTAQDIIISALLKAESHVIFAEFQSGSSGHAGCPFVRWSLQSLNTFLLPVLFPFLRHLYTGDASWQYIRVPRRYLHPSMGRRVLEAEKRAGNSYAAIALQQLDKMRGRYNAMADRGVKWAARFLDPRDISHLSYLQTQHASGAGPLLDETLIAETPTGKLFGPTAENRETMLDKAGFSYAGVVVVGRDLSDSEKTKLCLFFNREMDLKRFNHAYIKGSPTMGPLCRDEQWYVWRRAPKNITATRIGLPTAPVTRSVPLRSVGSSGGAIHCFVPPAQLARVAPSSRSSLASAAFLGQAVSLWSGGANC